MECFAVRKNCEGLYLKENLIRERNGMEETKESLVSDLKVILTKLAFKTVHFMHPTTIALSISVKDTVILLMMGEG